MEILVPIAIILFLVLANGLFVAAEFAAVSARMSRGVASAHYLLAGFLFHAFCILILKFDSTLLIRDKSRMRETRSYGSVRGVPGNRHPYRDRRFSLRDGNFT